jgi:hypothetical protein
VLGIGSALECALKRRAVAFSRDGQGICTFGTAVAKPGQQAENAARRPALQNILFICR